MALSDWLVAKIKPRSKGTFASKSLAKSKTSSPGGTSSKTDDGEAPDPDGLWGHLHEEMSSGNLRYKSDEPDEEPDDDEDD